MSEDPSVNRVTTRTETLAELGIGNESEWTTFAKLSIANGLLRVSDPMFITDEKCSVTCYMKNGRYEAQAKTIRYAACRYVSRVRACIDTPTNTGRLLGYVSVDFGQIAFFDPVTIERAADELNSSPDARAQADVFFGQLEAIREFGVARLGAMDDAVIAVASSGFGDGGYPVFDLLRGADRVGLEVVLIGPEIDS